MTCREAYPKVHRPWYRLIKPEGLREARVYVKGIPVAAQSINDRLIGADSLFNDGIGFSLGYVDLIAWASITAPTTGTSDIRDEFVAHEIAVFVITFDLHIDDGAFALSQISLIEAL